MTIYLFLPKYMHSPFINNQAIKLFKEKNIIVTKDIKKSDIIVSYNTKSLLFYYIFYRKKYLVWTQEPRYYANFSNNKKLILGFPNISIMNVYTGDVFWHNLHFLGSYGFDSSLKLGIDVNKSLPYLNMNDISALKNKKIAAIFSYERYNTKLIRNGMNIDFKEIRQILAMYGQRIGLVDIHGKGWPTGVSKESSGYGQEKNNKDGSIINWWERKLNILKDYQFNICLENTNYDYYCTEKIWHSIISKALPIYYGESNKIYETFPTNSFLDYSKYKTPKNLYDKIKSMSNEEYVKRLNKCIDVYNNSCKTRLNNYENIVQESTNRITRKIYEIFHSSNN